MDTVAVVPLKALDRAKERLSPHLDAGARRALAGWMLGRVIEACAGCRHVQRVLVVAGDEHGAELAVAAGAEALLQPVPGLTASLDAADAMLAGAAATLVVAADLPLALAEDLERVVEAAPDGPAVVVAPTSDGGTAALYRRPGRVIGTAYGPGSADAHLSLARAAGAAGVRLHLPRLALDIDTPQQLAEWRSRFPASLPGA
ncbi:MAG TPA: 2-phospho-L-lactate guanylyltransferase [Egibacteraceae bacterium]|nr:2-phospho-L-lactate guanylyltransferase [Egibacteraceae bacterium]